MPKFIVLAAALGALVAFVPASPVLAADTETNAVWNNLRPNLTPPFTGTSGKSAKTWKRKSASAADGTSKKHKK